MEEIATKGSDLLQHTEHKVNITYLVIINILFGIVF